MIWAAGMLKPSIASLFALSLVAGTAAADDASLTQAATPELPSVAITISPVHLLVPMAELTTELRVGERIGVAAIAGIGTFHDQTTNQRISLYEAGASARYYLLGSFRSGLQIGAEAVYVHAKTDAMVDVRAAGLAVSPFAGYKWTHSSGFTFEGQLGASYMAMRAKAQTGEMAERSAVGPMLNLNIGYSF